jgi:hypothetical protein
MGARFLRTTTLTRRRASRQAALASAAAITLLTSAAQTGCTKNVGANAAIAVAATVAAATAIRAASGSCYANCSYGTVCNHRTGLCVAQSTEQLKAKCVDDLGEDHCAGIAVGPSTEATPVPEEDDPCAGMCLDGESCVMTHGDLTCVGTPKPAARPVEDVEED